MQKYAKMMQKLYKKLVKLWTKIPQNWHVVASRASLDGLAVLHVSDIVYIGHSTVYSTVYTILNMLSTARPSREALEATTGQF